MTLRQKYCRDESCNLLTVGNRGTSTSKDSAASDLAGEGRLKNPAHAADRRRPQLRRMAERGI